MHAPALGQLLAERIVLGEARALDARPLALERFAEGRAHAPDPL
jgi:glycine/D-amino acid oxidase-like deaminating enzyme